MFTRRDILRTTSYGLGTLALSGLAAGEEKTSPLAPRAPHLSAAAKRVIFLCMRGGPSHMETFDHKPQLNADHGKPSRNKNQKFFGSQWAFQQYGESGLFVSDLLPQTAQFADELCVLNGMHCDSNEHAAALTQLHTGSVQFHRPSMGSWVLYGLGTENQNLPGFISIKPPVILGGARNYSSAFLPSTFEGAPLGTMSKTVREAKIANLDHPHIGPDDQRKQIDLVQRLNRGLLKHRSDDDAVEGLINSYELALRMQTTMPAATDLTKETATTLEMYGIGEKKRTDDFGRQCLLARRFAESGVRFIELTHDNWDHHGGVAKNMPLRCEQIDQPIAALLADLKQRGLLEDTLVVWGGEFGRTPDDPRGDGRGHNNKGFTVWLAGGGAKGGYVHGATDEYGYAAVEGRVHMHDLHATILRLLGIDHKRLTYRHVGRDYRLTDVYGNVVESIIA